MSESYYVYSFICNKSRKIGYTSNIKSRLASLQTGNPVTIEIDFVYDVATYGNADVIEYYAHKALKFAGFHDRGEWFPVDRELAKSVIEEAAKLFKCDCSLIYENDDEGIEQGGLGKDDLQAFFEDRKIKEKAEKSEAARKRKFIKDLKDNEDIEWCKKYSPNWADWRERHLTD